MPLKNVVFTEKIQSIGIAISKVLTCMFIFFTISLFLHQASALTVGEKNITAIASSPDMTYQIKRTQRGDIEVSIIQKGAESFQVNATLARKISENFVNLAKQVCLLKVRPDTVTISIGFISATWETERLCN